MNGAVVTPGKKVVEMKDVTDTTTKVTVGEETTAISSTHGNIEEPTAALKSLDAADRRYT